MLQIIKGGREFMLVYTRVEYAVWGRVLGKKKKKKKKKK